MLQNALPTVFLLGGVGALSRYAVLVLFSRLTGPFPAGIIIVNTLAALIGSALVAAEAPESIGLALGGGFVGSLGTLSSLCSETIALAERRRYGGIALFLGLTLVTGVFATLAGFSIGEALHD